LRQGKKFSFPKIDRNHRITKSVKLATCLFSLIVINLWTNVGRVSVELFAGKLQRTVKLKRNKSKSFVQTM